jgi:hypothetical protein
MTNEYMNARETKELLLHLSSYAKEHNLSTKSLAEKLGIPYGTTQKWWVFCQGASARKPSEPHLAKVKEFLLTAEKPEIYVQIEEARKRAEKVKYLLILLEDELGWFRDGDAGARDEFRKGLDASDIGYISSLLTMITDEDKFQRWLALSNARFNYFRKG